MILKLNDKKNSMKLVYQLSKELEIDEEQVALAQALTLDSSKPFGLKGVNGLFGSEEWWSNIRHNRCHYTLFLESLRRFMSPVKI